MKGLVYIWSQINLIPMMTPLLLFPVLWILRRLLQGVLERINAALVTLVIFAAVGLGTYWSIEESPETYVRFLKERGLETDANVLAVNHGSSPLMGGEYDEVEIGYQDPEGTPLKGAYISRSRRFFPLIQEPILLPAVGDKLRILFFPSVESGFVVLTDAGKSTYGAKLECNEAQLVLKKAELRYRHDDSPNRSDIEFLRKSVDFILSLDCIDLKERDRLRELRERLK